MRFFIRRCESAFDDKSPRLNHRSNHTQTQRHFARTKFSALVMEVLAKMEKDKVRAMLTKTLRKLHRQFFLVADRTSLNGRGVLGRKSLELPTQTDRGADGRRSGLQLRQSITTNKYVGEVVGRERLELPTSSV